MPVLPCGPSTHAEETDLCLSQARAKVLGAYLGGPQEFSPAQGQSWPLSYVSSLFLAKLLQPQHFQNERAGEGCGFQTPSSWHHTLWGMFVTTLWARKKQPGLESGV